MSTPGRYSSERQRRQYLIGEFTLDLEEGFLRHGTEEVTLRPKTFEVLTYLVQHSGRLVTKTELIDAVWPDTTITDNSLAQCLLEMRRALADEAQEVIRTVARRGYILTAPVTTPAVEWPRAASGTSIEPAESPTAGTSVTGLAASTRLRRRLSFTALLALAVAGGWVWYGSTRRPEGDEKLAVLPFKTIGSEDGGPYLALGMADALITKLSNVNRLIVRPTASVLKYATNQDPITAGRELGVDAVLDGTVQRFGNHIRLNVQLLRVSDGRSLWADKFDESLDDVFAVQDSISGKVADALLRNLTRGERIQVSTHYTASREAYELYARGRYSWEQRTEASLRQAVAYFEQAVRKDQRYALAYAALAECYGPLMQRSYMSAIDALPKMQAAASRAVELDDTLAEAHTALAAASMNGWDWPSAEREFKRAIELNPNDATAHLWYGFYLDAMGRQDENLAERRRAYELDPSNPTANSGLGLALFTAGHAEEAITFLKKAVALNPDFAMVHENLGRIYTEMRQYDKALEQYHGVAYMGERAYVLARSGDRNRARRNLHEFLALPPSQRPRSEMQIAAIYVALGDYDEALSWLERAYHERAPQLMFLNVEPSFTGLLPDPRFRDLLHRVRLL
jgi:DNA-binding winged helix-turn-helix (wHTH) protein/TolB-like protein/Tfp pilus assembly protein PilF